jgi:predicted DNA-binding protein (UPF0251 family)
VTVPRRVRRWHRRSGVPVIASDWGERLETGESAGFQPAWRGQAALRDPTEQWWWERQLLVWQPRTDKERAQYEALEDFFTPYIVQLRPSDQDIIRLLINDRLTYQEQAEKRGVKRQSAWEAVQAAVRRLLDTVSQDCPDPALSVEEGALCVLNHYWQERFGLPFPGIREG